MYNIYITIPPFGVNNSKNQLLVVYFIALFKHYSNLHFQLTTSTRSQVTDLVMINYIDYNYYKL